MVGYILAFSTTGSFGLRYREEELNFAVSAVVDYIPPEG